MLAFFFSMRIFNDGTPGWKNIITSDGRGYYAYLPAFFIDHDPTFSQVIKRESRFHGNQHYKPGYLVKSGDHVLNKYFVGEAFLLIPFFYTGMLGSYIAGTDIDGYSFFFQVFIGIGTLFYLFLGLIFLKKILKNLHIRQSVASVTIVAILFGTNLFYYSLWQPTMSHIFSFFAINGFLWHAMKAQRGWNPKTASGLGIFLGIVFLIRPTNVIIILLIPFLSENRTQLMRFFKAAFEKKRALFLFIMTFLTIISVQALVWFIQTGHIALWPYRNEGFNFGNPEIINVLFSYRKGLFIYTPLILISLSGLFPLMFRNRLQFFSMVIFLLVCTYVIASWWNWYYGDGFGLRAFIDYYGVFAILLAMIMNQIRPGSMAYILIPVLAPFILLNMVQTWQYTHRIIQPNSMNAAKYHHIFMRTDSAAINCLGGTEEIANYDIKLNRPVRVYSNDFESRREGWNNYLIVETRRAFSGSHAGCLDSVFQFSSGISIRAGLLSTMPAALYVTGEVMVWDSLVGASNGAIVVLSMDSIRPDENWWQAYRLNDVPVKTLKTWRKCNFSLMLPEISNPAAILKIYIWNTKKKPMLVDDFNVRFYGSR